MLVGCSRLAVLPPGFALVFKRFSFLAWFCVQSLLLLSLPFSSTTFVTAFSVQNSMADDNTHINNDTGKDDEWEAVPKKKKNTRDRPHHHHKKLQGDEFPSFLDSIPSYIHPPPPPLPPLATQSATDNHDDVAGDVLGSVEASTDDLVMILLVGFPGSGKSTWSQKLEQVMPWKYQRINQDELKTRNQCLDKAQQVLWMKKKCAIVDRCHVSREQRDYFLKLVEKNNRKKTRDCGSATATAAATATTILAKIPVDCIYFDVSKDTCLKRCRQRRNHPTLPASKADFVLNAMEKELEIPTIHEGFRNIYRIHDKNTFLQVLNIYLSLPLPLQS